MKLLRIATIFVAASTSAIAELQNVVVNGSYALNEALVTVVARDIIDGSDMAFWTLEPPASGSTSGHRLEDIAIPTQPRPAQYPDLGRVFLSVYTYVPAWDDTAASKAELTVEVDDYPAYSCPLIAPDWQLRLIDLRPWEGETVSLSFTITWLADDDHPVVLALPRLVASHGPYYSGVGGLSSGPGKGSISHVPPTGEPELRRVGVDGTRIENGPLMIRRVRCFSPSEILMKSAVAETRIELGTGFHWLALPLDLVNEPKMFVGAVTGMVERGPIDIVPNFLRGDDQRLSLIAATYRAEHSNVETSAVVSP